MSLPPIRVLWRQPDTLTLWGIPYDMRPGQSPYDIWRARRNYIEPKPGWYVSKRVDISDWIYMGEPGWWGGRDEERRLDVEALLRAYADLIPRGPCEWCGLDPM